MPATVFYAPGPARAAPRPKAGGRARTQAQTRRPFADWPAPTPADCRRAVQALAALHGLPDRGVQAKANQDAEVCGARQQVLAALVATLLSQHTTAANARAAMNTLWARFDGDYAAMCAAGPLRVAEAIRVGGLSNVKAARICALLADVYAARGAYDLEDLHGLSDEAVKQELTRFVGVGPKTASCVLLFALHRDSFAVDTHVLRISQKLGWVSPTAGREQAYLHLDARVPPELKYPLHVLLVYHGKCCPECAAGHRPQRPSEGPCPLVASRRRRRANRSSAPPAAAPAKKGGLL